MKYVPRQIRNVESLFINRPLIAINMGIEIFCWNGSFIRILRSFARVYRTVDLCIHLFFARYLRSVLYFFLARGHNYLYKERKRERVIRTAEIVVQSYDYYDAWFNLDACFALFLLVSFFFFFPSFIEKKTDHELFADGIKVLYNYSILVDYVWKNMNATNNKQV